MVFAAAVIVTGMSAYGFYAFATHDRLELLDLPEVTEAAEAGCGVVTRALERPTGDRPAKIFAGNAAIEVLIEDVNALGADKLADDLPAADWLADWRTLAEARGEFAARVTADPRASFDLPMIEDGYPITERMTWASGAACERAIMLARSP